LSGGVPPPVSAITLLGERGTRFGVAHSPASDRTAILRRTALFYVGVVGGSVLLFFWVRSLGAGLAAPALPRGSCPSA